MTTPAATSSAVLSAWQERTETSLMSTYRRQPIAIASGHGCTVVDTDGREYLDMLGGIAVNVLGHSHPAVVEAVSKQAAKLIHASSLYYTEPQLDLAEQLVATAFPSRVFFSNSGAEANEAAVKIARKWGAENSDGASEILCADGAFHGRTMGVLAATSNPLYQEPFAPMLPGYLHLPVDDLAAMEAAIGSKTVAIMVEPIMGESGVRVLDDAYLAGLRKLCDEHNLLLILDEVQSGMGRSGRWWAHQYAGITPDIMTVAKGLGGGLPIGATLATKRADVLTFGDHGTTFGASPLVCAAARAVVETIERENLVDNAQAMGQRIREKIADLGLDVVGPIHGRGLMLGIALNSAIAKEIVEAGLEMGVLINATNAQTLRLLPPLNITADEVDEGITRLGQAIRRASN
jgi:acetylornithine/N-succinyldiaminopimelate aminotransferase